MRVGELFAGIGGFGLAAQRAGCSLTWACEIDDFASRVYAARFPGVPIHPDVRDMVGEPVDCITGGFPCQDLSVAGKRKGLIGERSGLFWEITRIAKRLRPRWLLLENVPGLLSSHKGRDFETVLAALDEFGYGVSWRVLDAQFFGVPQRRRRVFIVGHLGAECPAEVLFESESVSGDSQARRKAQAGVTQSLTRSLGSGGADDNDAQGGLIVAQPLAAHHRRDDLESSTYVIQERAVSEGESGPDGKGWRQGQAYTLEARHHTQAVIVARPLTATSYKGHDEDTDTIVAHALTGEGFDAGEDGTGRGTPLVADALVASYAKSVDHAGTHGAGPKNVVGIRPRRLTPRECERLQGFPDDWTLIDGASDSARYRALGNAVAVPVVEWILRRMTAFASPPPDQENT